MSWIEQFNYPVGDLHGHGGWDSPAPYKMGIRNYDSNPSIRNNGFTAKAYNYNLNIKAQKISFLCTILYIPAMGSTSFSESVILRDIDNNPILGVGFSRGSGGSGRYIDVSVLVDGSLTYMDTIYTSSGTPCLYDIEYNILTQEYTKCRIFNIDYYPETGIGNSNNDIRNIFVQKNVNAAGSYLYTDNIYIISADKNSYLKFPQWQKTKYGMRPCY